MGRVAADERRGAAPGGRRDQTASVTFNRDLAPIVFRQCTPCHRPGQPAPFVLQTYADATNHVEAMLAAVQARRMPPWQADPACGPFLNARMLTTNEMALLVSWVESGMKEGEAKDLPPAPVFSTRWQLGKPDLVATPGQAYRLQATKDDTYYNLVIPLALDRPRYVRAVEFSPGTAGLVHHAFLRLDRSGKCRELDAATPEPGFPGVHLPSGVFSSDSQFLSWQPGRGPSEVPEGMTWPLQPGTDLILQLHLAPTKVPGDVQPSVGFHFSDAPPSRRGYKLRLTSFTFVVPPGASNHVVREEFTLPVGARMVALLPHAHRLAQRVNVSVAPPGGDVRQVLRIPRWDFDWQTDYNLSPELPLPAGTTIAAEFVYRNEGSGPVAYGPRTSDEMAELWVLLALESPKDYEPMARAETPRVIRDTVAFNEYRLRSNPADWPARLQIANAWMAARDFKGALVQLTQAVATAPEEPEPHYWRGYALRELGQPDDALLEFAHAIRLNPRHAPAHGNIGLIQLGRRNLPAAIDSFRRALESNPSDAIARRGLAAAESALKPAAPPNP